MRQHIVRYAAISSVAGLLIGVGAGGGKAAPAGRSTVHVDERLVYKPEVTFEAVREENTTGFLFRMVIAYDRGKWAIKTYRRDNTGKFVSFGSHLYDGSNTLPAIAWEYRPEDHTARPDGRSCDGALSYAVRQMGDAAARRRYAIPDAYQRGNSLLYADGPQGIGDIIGQWRTLLPASVTQGADPTRGSTWRLVGSASIAGQTCRIYETQYRTRPRPGGPPPYLSETIKSWVEPKSRLVLRRERHTFTPPGSADPPRTTAYEISSIRFPKSIPLSVFQLPPGTTAYVPETMKNAVVPPGVKRAPLTGYWAMMGVDLHEAR